MEERNGGLYMAGTRISLDSIVYGFKRGETPEQIRENFPGLQLYQVYRAIAHYLEHTAEVDRYLEEAEREFAANAIPLKDVDPGLWERFERARKSVAERRT